MQFIDLKRQKSVIENKLNHRISTVLSHGKFIMGPEVYELEEKLADYVNRKYCISCSSGTDALLIPLMALGIGPGDAVLTTSFSYIATSEVIRMVGATPIFIDIYNLRDRRYHQIVIKNKKAYDRKKSNKISDRDS